MKSPSAEKPLFVTAAYLAFFIILYSTLDTGLRPGFTPITIITFCSFSLLIIMTWRFVRQGYLTVHPFIDIPAVLFLCWCVVSVSYSVDRFVSQYGAAKFASGFFLFWMMARGLWTRKHIRKFAPFLALYLIILCFAGLIQYFSSTGMHYGRAHSTFVTPNSLGGLLILVLPILAAAFFITSGKIKVFSYSIFMVAWGTLIATGSRGAWLALFISCVVVCGLSIFSMDFSTLKVLPWKKITILIVGMAVVACIFLIPIKGAGKDEIASRASTLINNPLQAEPDRYLYWQSAWQIIKEKPLTGYGIRTFHLLYPRFKSPVFKGVGHLYAHNDYLQLTAEVGLIGILFFMWFLGSLGLYGLRILNYSESDDEVPWKNRGILMAAVTGMLAVFLHSFVDFNLYVPGTALPLWAAAGLVVHGAAEKGTVKRKRIFLCQFLVNRINLTGLVLIILWLIGSLFIFRPLAANLYSVKGFQYFNDGRLEDAKRSFRTAVRIHDIAFYHASLARVLAVQGEESEDQSVLDKAEQEFKTAIGISPYDASIYYAFARFYSRNMDLYGETKRSILNDLLIKGLALDPDQDVPHRELGRSYWKMGRLLEAEKHLEEYYRRAPEEPAGAILLARIKMDLGKNDEAKVVLRKILKKYSSQKEAAELLGQIKE